MSSKNRFVAFQATPENRKDIVRIREFLKTEDGFEVPTTSDVIRYALQQTAKRMEEEKV